MIRLGNNPIFDQLVRRRKWPSVRVAILMWVLMTGVCSGLSLAVPALAERGLGAEFLMPFIIGLASLLMLLISPLISGVVSAITTTTDTSREAFTLLKMSNISQRTVAVGFLYSALYRLRLLWVVCFGLLIPLGVGIMVIASDPSPVGLAPPTPVNAPPGAVTLTADEVILIWMLVIGGGVLGSGMNWLMVTVGVWGSMRWQQIAPAIGSVVGAYLLELVLLFGLMYALLWEVIGFTGLTTLFLFFVLGAGYIWLGTMLLGQYTHEA